jgi:hypothetical protein
MKPIQEPYHLFRSIKNIVIIQVRVPIHDLRVTVPIGNQLQNPVTFG